MLITGKTYKVAIKFSPGTLLENIDNTLAYIKKVNDTAFDDLENTVHYGSMTDNDRINAIRLLRTHNVLKLNRLDTEFKKLRVF